MPGSRRFLITVFKGIGDVILSTPLIRSIKKDNPANEVYFFTRRASEPVLRHNPGISGIILRGDGLKAARASLSALRAAAPDVALDFMLSSSSGLFTLLSGARERAAFRRPLGFLFYNIMPERKDRDYTVDTRYELLEALGVKPDGIRPEIYFTPENKNKADAFLSANGLNPAKTPVITFDITSPRGHRMWPAASFAKLADMLAEKAGARIIFTSGPGEKDYVAAAMAMAKHPHCAAPDFGLLDLAALSGRCAMHVGTSSAPMHIAVSQGTPTFTVYGLSTGPKSWSPPASAHAWAQGDLDKLSPEEVFEKASAHLASESVRAGR